VQRWQLGLILFGIALLAVGVWVLHLEVSPKRYIGILEWFLGALILHDGIFAPAIFGISVILRKMTDRVPFVIIALIEGALVIGAIVSLLFIPEILKKMIGTLSSSILPQDYALHLVVFYAVLAILTALAIGGYARMYRRQKLRSPAVQA
jgi:hypothetical protein